MNKLPTICLKDGTVLPVLGQGTWLSGEIPEKEENEKASLLHGIDRGMTVIDSAEGYGWGLSEEFIKRAVKDVDREKIFVISKVEPQNAGKDKIFEHCQNSLDHLGMDYLDMYMLHWRDDEKAPLAEVVESMEELIKQGKIRRWGVSNFDVKDMEDLWKIPNGDHCMVNQIQYNIQARGIEYSMVDWLKEHGVVLMAYAPMAHSGEIRQKVMQNPRLKGIAEKHGISMMQLLLAFTVRNKDLIAIPRSELPEHIDSNIDVLSVVLDDEDMKIINEEFPAPQEKIPLEII